MELNNKDKEKICNLIVEILDEKGVKIKDEWENNFSKEHDFNCFLQEFEEYLQKVKKYTQEKLVTYYKNKNDDEVLLLFRVVCEMIASRGLCDEATTINKEFGY